MRRKKIIAALSFGLLATFLFSMDKGEVKATESYDYNLGNYGINTSDNRADNDKIQDVLDKAKGSKKQLTFYFPAGKYCISSALKVYSNTHIILDSKATIYRMDSMVNVMLIHNVDQNGSMSAKGKYDMSSNIILEGGTWDGGNTSKAKDGSDIIRFDHAKNIQVKNCTVKNVYDCHSIEYVGVNNGLISNCTFSGFRYKKGKEKNREYAREAIQLEAAWTNNPKKKSDLDSLWAKGSVVDGTSCQNVTVTGCNFIDMPCGVGQHHFTSDGKYRNNNITISYNTFNCSTKLKYCKTAITCAGMNNVSINNNNVKGSYRFALHVEKASNVKVVDNVVSGVSMNGIMVDSGSVSELSRNTITNSAKHGISIGNGTITKVADNTITTTKHNGINIDAGKVSKVYNNTITNAKEHGISLVGKTKKKLYVSNVDGNTIKTIGHNGICVSGGTVRKIQNNTIKSTKFHGISVVAGTVGKKKDKKYGILNNTITSCKCNGVSVSGKASVSCIGGNKITSIKRNGISLINKVKVYYVTKNTIKKCTKHGIWNGSTKVKAKLKGNKGKTK